MKLFFDTEFTGLHKNNTLVSIGLISEDKKHSFYAELTDYDESQCDEWIQTHVISKLKYQDVEPFRGISKPPGTTEQHYAIKSSKQEVSDYLLEWLRQFKEIEFWGDCVAYDWILFIDLIGMGKTMRKMPKNFVSYQAFDVFTILKIKGYKSKDNRHIILGSDIEDTFNGAQHNALYDADITRQLYNKIMN